MTQLQIDWKKTLNLIIHTHTTDSIEFPISDIESLRECLVRSDIKSQEYKTLATQLKKDNELLRTKLLVAALELPNTDKVSSFKLYA